MAFSYVKAETKTKKWDDVSQCWRFAKTFHYTIKRDGEVIGSAETVITWPELYRGRRLGWVRGRKFRRDWQVSIEGRQWTIPGLRTRSEVLAEIKRAGVDPNG